MRVRQILATGDRRPAFDTESNYLSPVGVGRVGNVVELDSLPKVHTGASGSGDQATLQAAAALVRTRPCPGAGAEVATQQ